MTKVQDNMRSQATREALMKAGIKLFGEHGFDGTSTRALAAAAGANVASIAYHFGGKDGLRRACAEGIARKLGGVIEPVLDQAGADPDPETAATILERTAATMTRFILTGPETETMVPFLLREVARPGEVLDIVYEGVMRPVHAHVCALWAAATGGEPESEETKLAVFAAIGQVLYFRIGREIICRRMGWTTMGADEADRVAAVVTGNFRAIIAANRRDRP